MIWINVICIFYHCTIVSFVSFVSLYHCTIVSFVSVVSLYHCIICIICVIVSLYHLYHCIICVIFIINEYQYTCNTSVSHLWTESALSSKKFTITLGLYLWLQIHCLGISDYNNIETTSLITVTLCLCLLLQLHWVYVPDYNYIGLQFTLAHGFTK